ncbi:S-adenosyl-L-methionine-dependent methyltransferase [Lophiostoma macrostomum CBS 122681]|uniref:S-adenosyl-L-methionine-dependent methyltransferase n=1 Tax=Lophiostoma macrostomum CBS 122681 TaxID=1314788 RepID=A0A6A6SVP1_9PLEO|nr:S-adenosyl-L-methionine-dependent methyltransferase [Lophiostoma macrostomum CBS 122681]
MTISSDSANDIPRITQLASTISSSVAEIQRILTGTHTPFPSFDEDAPSQFPDTISKARDLLLDATAELHDLFLEPLNLVYKQGSHNNTVCLQFISRHNVASMVPRGGETSYAEIATKTGISEAIVTSLLRHAITMRIFKETRPGLVAHTNASKTMADPLVNDFFRSGTEEMWPACVKGFTVANGCSDSIYDVIGKTPSRAGRFANAMKVLATRPEYSPSFIVDNYDWATLGPARVLDVGGSQGHVAIALAQRYDNLHVLVQDMASMIADAESGVPDHLKDRVEFMSHDLFAPQVLPADVVFLRWVLHNWSDKYCIEILRAQIPALKLGGRIIIQDTIMPEPGAIPLWRERFLRSEDVNMMAVFNSRERTIGDWRKVIEPEKSALGIIEVVWNERT